MELSQDVRPYLLMAHFLTEDFKKVLEELLFLIREYGISQIVPKPGSREDYIKFASLVHEGWKKAQKLVIREVLQRLKLRDDLKKSIKAARILKNNIERKNLSSEINRIDMEVFILRRMVDSIAWNILSYEHSTIRRLQVRGGQNNFSTKNIEDAVSTIDLYNIDPFKMAICNDLTTFIHLGDILLTDIISGQKSFIELKGGDKNIAFAKAAEIASNCDLFDQKFSTMLSKNDIEHFARVKKQYQRGTNIIETINNEGGIDYDTKKHIRISPVQQPLEFYSDRIVNCCEKLNEEKNWAIDVVDECVHIGVYKDWKMAYTGFNVWMAGIKCTSRVYNITDSFRNPTVTPFASLNLPTEILTKIVLGKLNIILCFNVKAFVDRANKIMPGYFSFASQKESHQARQAPVEFLWVDNKVVKFGNDKTFLGQGFADRIIFDFQKPSNLFAIHCDAHPIGS